MLSSGFRAAALCSTVALGMMMAATGAASATSSSAFGVEASFTWKHLKTGIGQVGAISGGAPPAYAKSASIGSFRQVVPLLPTAGSAAVPTLYVAGAAIATHVSASGVPTDAGSAAGSAVVKNFDISLMPPPLGPKKVPIDIPFLDIAASAVSVNTSLTPAPSQSSRPSSTAAISGLKITGSLVNSQTITFSGDVPNNTVLFQSDAVTITVNAMFSAGVISCTPTCVFWPVTVTGKALDIVLTDANLDGNIVSGEIVVAGAQAGSGGLLSKPAELPAGK
jgi:hypothetical protein